MAREENVVSYEAEETDHLCWEEPERDGRQVFCSPSLCTSTTCAIKSAIKSRRMSEIEAKRASLRIFSR